MSITSINFIDFISLLLLTNMNANDASNTCNGSNDSINDSDFPARSGCASFVSRLFAGSTLDEKVIDLLVDSVESQGLRRLESPSPTVLRSLSKFISDIPEENLTSLEEDAMDTKTGELVKCIRFPTLVTELTGGGKISVESKKLLGTEVLNWFRVQHDVRRTKIIVKAPIFSDGRKLSTQHEAIRYTREDVLMLIVLTWRFLQYKLKDEEIIY
ncbi:hypothetical protein [Acanthamoeba polyphaga mimivirus]|uniref:Uncharacterized protein n=1 Tax=Acanthamoeba polyphaga mimivirus TaxID=212035 RepID=A0A0G2Y4L8_MIMIV|nr:hypothetical protein [Acanthamoeba polyphaga mimivirus]